MINCLNISKSYKKKQVLKNISLSSKEGELIVIIGENGSGKSTLMQILSGALKPDSGKVYIKDKDATKDKSLFRKYVGYVPQQNPLIEELSVKDNLKLWGFFNSKINEEISKEFELESIMKETVSKLSGGMKKRLSIACALCSEPSVLLLDEPTTGLDLRYKEIFKKFILSVKQKGGTVIFSSHDLNEIMLADRCLCLKNGVISELIGDSFLEDSVKSFILLKERSNKNE